MERYIGKTLDHRYEILEIIGTGGMAVVFKAKCHRLNRLVAVKMLKKDLSQDAEFRRKFHEESQSVAMLSHPNIMAVYDVSRGGDMDYIVMELLDGITLKQYMAARKGNLDWRETLHFITQIMRGLSHAHSRNLIHRDIKPQNIMVLRDGTVKVTDFGIACLSNGKNSSHEAIGSVHYISPEQAKGDYTDNRSDIYSAGVVLYEMLTGRLPFDGDNPVSVAIQHFSAVPQRPREINPDIPEALEQICMKAMATDRKKRYNTADEMIADLDAFRKDPSLRFDYSMEQLRDRSGEEEPTKPIPNVSVATANANTNPQKPSKRKKQVEDDDDDYGPPRWWSWLKGLLLLALFAGLGYYAATTLYDGVLNSFTPPAPTEYAVPRVIGLTLEEAMALPEVEGIFTIVDTYYEYDNEYPKGTIISQSPEEGRSKKIVDGALIPITVTVSRGVTSSTMPYLIGEEVRAAKLILNQNKELAKLNLNIEVVEDSEYHDEIPAGCILRTEPMADTTLKEGETITLYLSRGPEIIYRTMISCLGQNMEWVQLQMKSMNLVPVFQGVEDATPVGTVLSQSVDPNTEIAEGSTVTFTYSEGLKMVEKKITYHLPTFEYDVKVIIYLDDTVVFESDLPGDYGAIDVTLFATVGKHTVRIYVDDILRQEGEITFG